MQEKYNNYIFLQNNVDDFAGRLRIISSKRGHYSGNFGELEVARHDHHVAEFTRPKT